MRLRSEYVWEVVGTQADSFINSAEPALSCAAMFVQATIYRRYTTVLYNIIILCLVRCSLLVITPWLSVVQPQQSTHIYASVFFTHHHACSTIKSIVNGLADDWQMVVIWSIGMSFHYRGSTAVL